jgi:hypothetical protein
VLFSGDLIFQRGVGRTDLPGGSWKALEESIRSHVFSLPEGTRILPGHGGETEVVEEKRGERQLVMISLYGEEMKKVITYKKGKFPNGVEVVGDENELLHDPVERRNLLGPEGEEPYGEHPEVGDPDPGHEEHESLWERLQVARERPHQDRAEYEPSTRTGTSGISRSRNTGSSPSERSFSSSTAASCSARSARSPAKIKRRRGGDFRERQRLRAAAAHILTGQRAVAQVLERQHLKRVLGTRGVEQDIFQFR